MIFQEVQEVAVLLVIKHLAQRGVGDKRPKQGITRKRWIFCFALIVKKVRSLFCL